MKKPIHLHLSRRESQIMDIVFRLGEATAAEVRRNMPDSTSYNAVRVTMNILEGKGHLTHRLQSPRHVYRPCLSVEKAKRSVLRHVLTTFFGGSTPRAVSTLMDMSASDLSNEELEELAQLVEQARKERAQ